MIHARINTIAFFSFRELCILYAGKIFSGWRHPSFDRLQERENKLQMLGSVQDLKVDSKSLSFTRQIGEKNIRFFLRIAGSDVFAYHQVMNNVQYKPVVDLYRRTFKDFPKHIIDAGANAGLTILFFKMMNENARILAIEPDINNCAVARKNILQNNLQDVRLIDGGLWPIKTRLEVVNDFRDKNEWSFRVLDSQLGTVPSITPEEALSHFSGVVDLFKIDIEGSEKDLFEVSMNFDWLYGVKMIAIEIHDEFGKREQIRHLLECHDFRLQELGETTVGVNARFFQDHAN